MTGTDSRLTLLGLDPRHFHYFAPSLTFGFQQRAKFLGRHDQWCCSELREVRACLWSCEVVVDGGVEPAYHRSRRARRRDDTGPSGRLQFRKAVFLNGRYQRKFGHAPASMTASAFNDLAWTWGTACSTNIIWTCPETRSISAGGEPLYGTCRMSIPASTLSNSPSMCDWVPKPGDA